MPKCQNVARYRFTWPGRDESFICDEHVEKLIAVAQAMGFHLQIIPTWTSEKCRQELEETCLRKE